MSRWTGFRPLKRYKAEITEQIRVEAVKAVQMESA